MNASHESHQHKHSFNQTNPYISSTLSHSSDIPLARVLIERRRLKVNTFWKLNGL